METVSWFVVSAWRSVSEPPTKMEGKAYSAYIWIRVAAKYKGDILDQAAYTTIGRCCFPTVYSHSEPYNPALPDSAGKAVWVEGEPVFQEGYQSVAATAWMPISEPLPPEVSQWMPASGTINSRATFSIGDSTA